MTEAACTVALHAIMAACSCAGPAPGMLKRPQVTHARGVKAGIKALAAHTSRMHVLLLTAACVVSSSHGPQGLLLSGSSACTWPHNKQCQLHAPMVAAGRCQETHHGITSPTGQSQLLQQD